MLHYNYLTVVLYMIDMIGLSVQPICESEIVVSS